MFIVASIMSFFSFFLNSFNLDLNLRENINNNEVIESCARTTCHE